MDFEWDRSKAAANKRKHGVTFGEAASVFFDPLAVSGGDPDYSFDEYCYVTFGYSSNGRLLAVVHAVRSESIRIISARRATRAERKIYEES